jgi:hypothetical protein
VQQVDGAELVFRNAIRTPKVIRQSSLCRVVLIRRVAQVPEYIVDTEG